MEEKVIVNLKVIGTCSIEDATIPLYEGPENPCASKLVISVTNNFTMP